MTYIYDKASVGSDPAAYTSLDKKSGEVPTSAPRWKSLKREALGPKKLAGLSDYICITAYQNSSVLIAKPFEAVQAQVNSVLTRVLVTSIC